MFMFFFLKIVYFGKCRLLVIKRLYFCFKEDDVLYFFYNNLEG